MILTVYNDGILKQRWPIGLHKADIVSLLNTTSIGNSPGT